MDVDEQQGTEDWDTDAELFRLFTLANNGQGLSMTTIKELLRLCNAIFGVTE